MVINKYREGKRRRFLNSNRGREKVVTETKEKKIRKVRVKTFHEREREERRDLLNKNLQD